MKENLKVSKKSALAKKGQKEQEKGYETLYGKMFVEAFRNSLT